MGAVPKRPGLTFFLVWPAVTGRVLGLVHRWLVRHLIRKTGFSRKVAHTGATALIQRFGSALNLNHFNVLFFDKAYGEFLI